MDRIAYRKAKIDDESICICQFNQPSGARLNYTHKDHKDDKYKQIINLKLRKPKGLSNGSGNEISGRTNLKNQKINFKPQKNYFECISGAGNKSTFSFLYVDEGTRIYTQTKEDRVNGSAYKYDPVFSFPSSVKRIRCINANKETLFSEINLKSPRGDFFDSLTVLLETSDDRSIIYKYFKHKSTERIANGDKIKYTNVYLKGVTSAHKPTERYSYYSEQKLFDI